MMKDREPSSGPQLSLGSPVLGQVYFCEPTSVESPLRLGVHLLFVNSGNERESLEWLLPLAPLKSKKQA